MQGGREGEREGRLRLWAKDQGRDREQCTGTHKQQYMQTFADSHSHSVMSSSSNKDAHMCSPQRCWRLQLLSKVLKTCMPWRRATRNAANEYKLRLRSSTITATSRDGHRPRCLWPLGERCSAGERHSSVQERARQLARRLALRGKAPPAALHTSTAYVGAECGRTLCCCR